MTQPKPGHMYPRHMQVEASRATVDEGIRDLLELVWANGFDTQFSCQGRTSNQNAYIVFDTFEQAARFILETNIRTNGGLWQHITLVVMNPLLPQPDWRGSVEWHCSLTAEIARAWR